MVVALAGVIALVTVHHSCHGPSLLWGCPGREAFELVLNRLGCSSQLTLQSCLQK